MELPAPCKTYKRNIEPGYKYCPHCQTVKRISEFYDGLDYCRSCVNEQRNLIDKFIMNAF